jgi:tetratricopeptide (TPR) repeat protein
LIDLLLDVAQRDDRLYRALLLNAERSSGGPGAIRAFRTAIDGATRVRDFLDWREAHAFAANVDEVVDSLAELLKPDSAATLVELCEYAIERLENSLQQVDDSNGEAGAIGHRLGELHLKACTMARPEPRALAERLFRLEMTLPFRLCPFDPVTYEGPLGKSGLRRFRELVETAWRKVKPLSAKEPHDDRRSRITRIMEGLAEADGNMEELAAIKARDLSSSYRYLDLAETWMRAKRSDEAQKWAERGLKAFRERPDNRLRDFLVAAYLKRGRNDEALQLTWIQFEEEPRLQHYRKLRDVAKKLGVWPAQRTRALSLVAEVAMRAAAATNKWKPKPSQPDQSLRVEIALWEDDIDAAWAAAHEGTCNRRLLLDLAGKLERFRPRDAVSLYRRVVPSIVGQTNNNAYAEAIKVIRKAAKLMKSRDGARQLSDYLAELHVQFKAKRNFIRMLDGIAREHARS